MVIVDRAKARVFSELSDDGGTLTIRISGSFDFNLHREFQRAYQNLPTCPRRCRIDLSETLHLDSAALGMLLLLRDHCLGRAGALDRHAVELFGANNHVENILQVSNFDKIFTLR